MHYHPIEHYGIIGDLHTTALVGMNGSIDFMCFPEFDSPTLFARLLDHEKGGYFQLAPVLERGEPKQLYLPDSNILLTRFLGKDGVSEVSDFMPIKELGHAHDLVRRAKSVRGDTRFRMVLSPRFNYARSGHTVEQKDNEWIFASQGPDRTVVRLRAHVPVRIENGEAVAEFTLRAGQSTAFVLEEVKPGQSSPSCQDVYVADAFKETLNYWRRWAGRSRYKGRWRDMVSRSALTLKMLTSATHGSLVAAPTFGLPERLGGERNWDYRYTWIRDASFTIYALMRLGYTEEASAFMRWVEARCGDLDPDGSLQVMYGLDGRKELPETPLDHLEGYKQSRPVRVGNGAARQLQLDIYGELMDSVYLHNKYAEPISYDFWRHLVSLIDWVCQNWRRPDEGIWEIRGGAQQFLYSRVMCWVAVDRGIRLAQKRSFPAPLAKWLEVRDTIYRDIYDQFWAADLNMFVQHKGARHMDAACLLMPLVKFISPHDPRWVSTLRAVQTNLATDSLVYRYDPHKAAHDGLSGEEGTFSICSFWLVECLSRLGDVEQARLYFEKSLGYASHLGLYAEEIGPYGEHLGNFPQAFTHLGLISAAHNLNLALGD